MSSLDEQYAELYKNKDKIIENLGIEKCDKCGSKEFELDSGDINWEIWFKVICKKCREVLFDSYEDEEETRQDFINSGG